jgi:hypothetical protein
MNPTRLPICSKMVSVVVFAELFTEITNDEKVNKIRIKSLITPEELLEHFSQVKAVDLL